MRASTFICTNIEEIEMAKEENEKLNLPSPPPLHIEDVTRAYTRNINNKAVASLVFSDGSYMDVKMTSEMEDMLDILFRNTL